MELSVNPGPKPIGHVIQASIALQRYKIIRNFQIKMQKNKRRHHQFVECRAGGGGNSRGTGVRRRVCICCA